MIQAGNDLCRRVLAYARTLGPPITSAYVDTGACESVLKKMEPGRTLEGVFKGTIYERDLRDYWQTESSRVLEYELTLLRRPDSLRCGMFAYNTEERFYRLILDYDDRPRIEPPASRPKAPARSTIMSKLRRGFGR